MDPLERMSNGVKERVFRAEGVGVVRDGPCPSKGGRIAAVALSLLICVGKHVCVSRACHKRVKSVSKVMELPCLKFAQEIS